MWSLANQVANVLLLCHCQLILKCWREKDLYRLWQCEWLEMAVACLLATVIFDEKEGRHKIWSHFINNGVTCWLESLCCTILSSIFSKRILLSVLLHLPTELSCRPKDSISKPIPWQMSSVFVVCAFSAHNNILKLLWHNVRTSLSLIGQVPVMPRQSDVWNKCSSNAYWALLTA